MTLRHCLEQAWDRTQFVGCDLTQWAKTHGMTTEDLEAQAESVRLSRASRIAPDVVELPDMGGGGK